jgi:hypothetical protein
VLGSGCRARMVMQPSRQAAALPKRLIACVVPVFTAQLRGLRWGVVRSRKGWSAPFFKDSQHLSPRRDQRLYLALRIRPRFPSFSCPQPPVHARPNCQTITRITGGRCASYNADISHGIRRRSQTSAMARAVPRADTMPRHSPRLRHASRSWFMSSRRPDSERAP